MNDLFDKGRADRRVISIRGAREHNLKNIDLDIPRDRLVVFTGLSGSGKSSLAFDTIYAEGQRRYVESLSAYARQFLEMMQKPDVDQIDGLSPAISIEQKTTSRNPRSTVGTVTEIYDYMRLLWARVGVPYSPATGLPIESQTVSQMVDRIMALPEGTRLYLLAPVVRGRKGEYRKELAEFMKKGYQRVKIDGAFYEIAAAPALDKKFTHDIDVVVDRIVVRPDIAARLADSLEQALKLADGLAVAELADASSPPPERGRLNAKRSGGGPSANDTDPSPALRAGPPLAGEGVKKTRLATAAASDARRFTFSEKFACPVSGFTIPEIEPRLFSFNNPFGACPKCGGLGVEQHIDADLVIPDKDRTLRKGAIAPWAKSSSPYYTQTLTALGKHYKFTLDTKWKDLPKKTQDAILYGSGDTELRFSYDDGMRAYDTKRAFEGVITNLERRYKETDSDWAREEIARYFTDVPCAACAGYRLKPEALCVKVGSLHIGQVSELSVKGAAQWFTELPQRLTSKQNEIAVRVLKEIRERLKFLVDVGLEYLTLARATGTLSGGESQRIRLASQIGSGLTGVLYVLDEPSIGLHQRDNARLLETLKRLRDLGNTVIVVEHDEDAIRTADWVLDIGPGAGIHGGHIIAQGTVADLEAAPQQLDRQISVRHDDGANTRTPGQEPGARAQNHRRPRQQPEKHHRRNSAGAVHLRHRRVRRRQVDAARRHAVQGAGAAAQQCPRGPRPLRPHRGRRASRQDHRYRPVADRPHAAQQSRDLYRRLHAHSRVVCRPARKPRPAATSPAASRSTSKAAAAKPARATASSRSRCIFCPTSMSPATSATASATTAKRWTCCSAANRSPTCST